MRASRISVPFWGLIGAVSGLDLVMNVVDFFRYRPGFHIDVTIISAATLTLAVVQIVRSAEE